MKFSVLMSLYVKEKPEYLVECLDSLRSQTYPADEIVVVFDGEVTAALESVIEKYQKLLPIKIVRLEKNLGLGKALNEGLKYCRNDWVFRMDTDDICVPQRFQKQVDFILNYPNTVIFGGQIAEFNQSVDDIVSYRKVPLSAKDIVDFTLKRSPFNHMTVAYKKQAVQSVGGYQDLQEDYYLWINLVAKYPQKIANLSEILVYARVGNGMVGRRRGIAQARCEWRLFRLKQRLGIQGRFAGVAVLIARLLPRLLPVSLLQFVYKFLRK
ncbi:glycosyltransferase [Rodentibacter caecimuris]|uniref:Amylovoran biosynthesis protein AmsE n=1 Tax=Rodentibacter caecimuris TaxID=1796644 RepID=A0ABX3KV99_9PAST|nr:amylovoran biosynthesis protein AmsE [Rodentibacter heylii]